MDGATAASSILETLLAVTGGGRLVTSGLVPDIVVIQEVVVAFW